jgi:ATP-dependent RNA helicase DHX37/DHR1
MIGTQAALLYVNDVQVSNFPFPSPPDPHALQAATRCLVRLSALEPAIQQLSAAAAAAGGVSMGSGPLTAVGRAMAVFPVTPRHSRMLLQLAIWQQQQQQGVSAGPVGVVGGVSAAAAAKTLPYAVALAATLSVESPFMHIDALNAETEAAAAAAESESAAADAAADDDEATPRKQQQKQQTAEAKAANRKKMSAAARAHARFRSPHGDAISALNALSAYEAAAAEGSVEDFCAENFLHARHLREMSQLRQQLGRTLQQLQQGLGQGQGQLQPHLPAIGGSGGVAAEAQQLMQQLLSGLQGDAGEQLMQPLPAPSPAVLDVLRRALAAGWCDQVSASCGILRMLRCKHRGAAVL